VLIVSRPIIKSNDEGPILGSLIMGYYYDSSRLDRLTEITHLPIMLQRFDATEMPDGFKEALSFFSTESSIFVTPLNSDFIVGYTLLEDVYGDPSVVFRIDLPRTIYKQGLASTTYFSLFLITTGITFGTLFIVILERTMLSRLAQLNNDVNLIQLHGDPSKRVKVAGKDELSNLATEINDMLSSLEKSQNKLRLINEKLGVVGSLTRHDARNKLAVIENNVYLAKQKLSGDLNVHDNLSEIETASERICKLFDFAKTYENIGAEELSSIHVEKSVKEAAMILGLGNVKLLLDCPDLIVKADSLVRQLFYNLIDNSLKHGENISKIKVYCDEMEGQTKIVYEDDGIGIPVHEKEKIFEKGYGKGTGYGLYLIKKICEAYGWTIKETGKYGKGARFIITIQKANN
jgi:signal transduction histidine kinase